MQMQPVCVTIVKVTFGRFSLNLLSILYFNQSNNSNLAVTRIGYLKIFEADSHYYVLDRKIVVLTAQKFDLEYRQGNDMRIWIP